MFNLGKKSFDAPDRTIEVLKAKVAVADIDGVEVRRMTAEPGWHWAESMGPVAGTDSCQINHVIFVAVSGQLAVQMDDGTTTEFGPGDVGMIPAGHDAWVVGNQPFVAIDFQGGAIRQEMAA